MTTELTAEQQADQDFESARLTELIASKTETWTAEQHAAWKEKEAARLQSMPQPRVGSAEYARWNIQRIADRKN